MKRVPIVVVFLAVAVVCQGAWAQSLSERIQTVREQRDRQAKQDTPQPEQPSLEIPRKMRTIIDEVLFDQTPAKDVYNWWSQTTGIPLVIDWEGMAQDGVEEDQGITLELKTVPARLLLDVIMRQTSQDVDLIYEVTPWYVQVMTKRQANRNPVLKVYDVSDMVMTVPNFTNAPSFDLTEALSNTSSGGGGRGGGGGGGGGGSQIFTDNNDNADSENVLTKDERGQNLADLIRETIEPEVWAEYGGQSSVRYFDGRLIVNAPMYVHRQIQMPAVKADHAGPAVNTGYKSATGGTADTSPVKPFGTAER